MLRRGPFALRITAFVLLCLWASAGWIWAEALPSQMGAVAGQGLHLLLIGAAMTAWSLLRRVAMPRWGYLASIALGGLGLFAGPTLLLHAARSMVPSSLGVVVFSLLPVVVMVASGGMKGLLPALMGVAGVLVLLPVSLPQGRGILGVGLMAAAMGLTAGAILWLNRRLSSVGWGWAVAAICLTNGILLSLAGWEPAGWDAVRYEAVRACLIDAPEVLLLIWLIGALEPRRLAARWLVAPLFTVVEGYLLMRPEADLRLVVGVVLLGVGAGWVFSGKDDDIGDGGHIFVPGA